MASNILSTCTRMQVVGARAGQPSRHLEPERVAAAGLWGPGASLAASPPSLLPPPLPGALVAAIQASKGPQWLRPQDRQQHLNQLSAPMPLAAPATGLGLSNLFNMSHQNILKIRADVRGLAAEREGVEGGQKQEQAQGCFSLPSFLSRGTPRKPSHTDGALQLQQYPD